MIISLIAAASENNVIGAKKDIPWRLPKDTKYFLETTRGHTVIMGRTTFESIGKALPKRVNIVITRQKNYTAPGAIVVHSLEEALAEMPKNEEVFIIGGGELYKESLPEADRVYLTRVHTTVAGDTFFPILNKNEWRLTQSLFDPKDDNNPFDATYEIYERKKL